MLTKDDLKDIRKVIREEVKAEVKDVGNNLGNQLRLTKITLSNDIHDLDDRIKNVEIRVDNFAEATGKEFKHLKKKINKIESNVDDVLGFLDKKDVELGKRVTKIEEHLNLPQNYIELIAIQPVISIQTIIFSTAQRRFLSI